MGICNYKFFCSCSCFYSIFKRISKRICPNTCPVKSGDFLQPQLVVLPLFKLLEVEICSPPQSHLQSHLRWPLAVEGNCSTTVSFQNFCPIKDGYSLMIVRPLQKSPFRRLGAGTGSSITEVRYRIFCF